MKITNDSFLVLTTNPTTDDLILAEGRTGINELLTAGQRAEPQYGEGASHRTASTRKYQCNAPIAWERMIAKVSKAVARETGDEREGAAIRYVLAAGLAALGFEASTDAE